MMTKRKKMITYNSNKGPLHAGVVWYATDAKHVHGQLFSVAPTYDPDGNMTSDGIWSYDWDAENRLIEVQPLVTNLGSTLVQYMYDAQSRRIARREFSWMAFLHDDPTWRYVQGRAYRYDGWNLLHELKPPATPRTPPTYIPQTNLYLTGTTGPVAAAYVWGLDLSDTLHGAGGVGGLLQTTRNGTNAFSFYDANGNINDLVDTNGVLAAHYEYDGFGNTIAQSGDQADAHPVRFSSKYWEGKTEGETGFYYYGYRDYHPETGRWTRPGPIGEIGGLNLFGFVQNCPVCSIDYLGTEFEDLGAYTVFDLLGAHGWTVADFTLDAECVPSSRHFLRGEWCRCELKLTKFHVRVQSMIVLYNVPNGYVSGAPIPRYAEDFITDTIQHEAKHREHFGNWHDEKLSQAEADFSGTYECKLCEEKKADLRDEWQGKWQTFWNGEAGHSNPGWEGWTLAVPTYAAEDDWWKGDIPLPLDDPFDDPLGKF